MNGYTVNEAANVLGVPEQRVWELLARGVLSGVPEGETGMRVFLRASVPAPLEMTAEPPPPAGDGHDGSEASPFRELLSEFRNLTERYGQALLALGEARGEVASLRARVDLLEARMDLRLPPARPTSTVAWEIPDYQAVPPAAAGPEAPATETSVQAPGAPEEVAPADAGMEPEPILEPAVAEVVLETDEAAPPASPAELAPAPDVGAPEETGGPMPEPPAEAEPPPARIRRRSRRSRASVTGIAQALARAQDPTLAGLPGAQEAAAALEALQAEIDHREPGVRVDSEAAIAPGPESETPAVAEREGEAVSAPEIEVPAQQAEPEAAPESEPIEAELAPPSLEPELPPMEPELLAEEEPEPIAEEEPILEQSALAAPAAEALVAEEPATPPDFADIVESVPVEEEHPVAEEVAPEPQVPVDEPVAVHEEAARADESAVVEEPVIVEELVAVEERTPEELVAVEEGTPEEEPFAVRDEAARSEEPVGAGPVDGEVAAEGATDEPVATVRTEQPAAEAVPEPDWYADGDFTWLEASEIQAAAEARLARPPVTEAETEADEAVSGPAAPDTAPAAPTPEAEPEGPEAQAAEASERQRETPAAVEASMPGATQSPEDEAAQGVAEAEGAVQDLEEAVQAEAEVREALEAMREDERIETPHARPSTAPAAQAEVDEAPFDPIPVQAFVRPPSPPRSSPEVPSGEEALMWLGDEFEAAGLEMATPGWHSEPQRGESPAPAPHPTTFELGDAELAQLAQDEGWDPDEVEAIRSFLGRPTPPSAPQSEGERPASGTVEGSDADATADRPDPDDRGQTSPSADASAFASLPRPIGPLRNDWLRGRRGPAATAYRRLRRLFPG